METELNKKASSPNWEDTLLKSDGYIKDMLSYYEEGWEARGDDDRKQFENRIKANVVNTFTYLDEVKSELLEHELTAKETHIRLESPSSFTVIIALSSKDFMSDRLMDIYTKAHQIEKASRSENYRVIFNFTYDDGDLSQEVLKAEGYIQVP